MKPQTRSDAGATLVELLIAAAITATVFSTVSLGIVDGLNMSTHSVGSSELQETARRALESIRRDLQKTGRIIGDAATGVDFPVISSNGTAPAGIGPFFTHNTEALTAIAATFAVPPAWTTPASPLPFVAPGSELEPQGIREIAYRLPVDRDNDGRILSATTGALEWGTNITALLLIPNGDALRTMNLIRRTVQNNGVGPAVDEVLCRHVQSLTFDTTVTKNILPLSAIEIHLHLIRNDTQGRPHHIHVSTTFTMRN